MQDLPATLLLTFITGTQPLQFLTITIPLQPWGGGVGLGKKRVGSTSHNRCLPSLEGHNRYYLCNLPSNFNRPTPHLRTRNFTHLCTLTHLRTPEKNATHLRTLIISHSCSCAHTGTATSSSFLLSCRHRHCSFMISYGGVGWGGVRQ